MKSIHDRLKPQIFKSCQKQVKKYESIGEFILTSLDRHENVELFIDCESDRRWTGHTMGQFVRRIGIWLIDELNMKPGQISCISYDHSDISVALSLAILCAGGVVSCLDSNDPYPEILYLAKRIHPSFLFCHNNRANLVDQLRNDLAKITKSNSYNLKFASPDGDEIKKFLIESQSNNLNDNNNNKFNQLPVKAHGNCNEMLAVMSLSSGTTGIPKVIAIDHENCFSLAQNSHLKHKRIISEKYDDDLEYYYDENKQLNQVTISCLTPFHYVSGRLRILRTIEIACRLALIRGGNIDNLIKCVNKYKINCAYLGAGVFQSLVCKCLTSVPQPKLDSIRLIMAMSGHLASIEQICQFFQLYPHICYCVQGYGTSETNVMAFANYQTVDKFLKNPNNCGQLLPNYQLKIADINKNSKHLLGADQRGMFHVGGPYIFHGYYDAEQVSEPPHLICTQSEIFDSDGFYITDDIGWIDSRTGDVYFEGRLKELMCCRGCKKVFPHELENLIVQHDQVEECIVLGIQSEREIGIDCPRAFIVPSNVLLKNQIHQPPCDNMDDEDFQNQTDSLTPTIIGHNLSPSNEIFELAKNVLEFAHANIGWEKQLTGGICVLREIPRIRASGKINKRYLRSLNHQTAFIYDNHLS